MVIYISSPLTVHCTVLHSPAHLIRLIRPFSFLSFSFLPRRIYLCPEKVAGKFIFIWFLIWSVSGDVLYILSCCIFAPWNKIEVSVFAALDCVWLRVACVRFCWVSTAHWIYEIHWNSFPQMERVWTWLIIWKLVIKYIERYCVMSL